MAATEFLSEIYVFGGGEGEEERGQNPPTKEVTSTVNYVLIFWGGSVSKGSKCPLASPLPKETLSY